jgi:drug/metabolite transporter (DMT)-like permease
MDSGVVLSLIPVFTFALAMLARQEPFRLSRAAGIAVALAGVSLLTAGAGELSGSHRLGNVLMVSNALSYSIYLVLSRGLAQRYPPVVTIAWVYACALPAVPVFLAGATPWPADADARAWWSLAFILAFPTVLAYLLNVFALSRLRASTTAVYVYGQPLITGSAAVAWLGEELPFATLGAAALVFTGLYLVARRPPTA